MTADELMLPPEVSDLYRVPVTTLARWRNQDPPFGPPAIRLGRRVVYRRSVVLAWITEQEAAEADRTG